MASSKTQARFSFWREAEKRPEENQMSLMYRVRQAIFGEVETKEVSRLQNKVRKLGEAVIELESDNKRLNQDLTDSLSTTHENAILHTDSVRGLETELATEKEKNRALLEKTKELEFQIAESKSRLALNAVEREIMSDLLNTLRERVSTTIASLADSYGHHQRPERDTDGIPPTR